MKLLLPQRIITLLRRELRGRTREIGGVLVGEHVKDDVFRLVDLSIQASGGTAAHFVRDPERHRAFLADFFARTGHDYQRYNYLGEWHSHPSFEPVPSPEDRATMLEIVDDPRVGAHFAVLIIARLRRWARLELSATLFRTNAGIESICLQIETEAERNGRSSVIDCILSFIRP
jgi:integrative and conjugative element protein (TIGR02256 family)